MARIVDGICLEINSNVQTISNIDVSTLEFSCGNKQIDKYLHTDASKDINNVTYVFTDADSSEIIAFASLRCSGIIFSTSSSLETYPAIEIRYFATSEKYQHIPMDGGQDDSRFCISDCVFSQLISMIREIAEETVGARYITLYSVPDAVGFYKRNFFVELPTMFTPEHYRYIDECLPMYMDLANT